MIEYRTIGLGYTLTCPLACEHCITESSPEAKGRMSLEQAQSYLLAIRQFSPAVCFTGGEALLYHREIVELIREAKKLGLRTSLVTSAGWVRKEKTAQTRVRELANAGLGEMCISWDQYHEAFARREGAQLLARLALEAGVKVIVRTIFSEDKDASEHGAGFESLPVEMEAFRVIKLGRGASLPASHFMWLDTPPKGPCNSLIAPLIDSDGTVYACCGPSRFSHKSSPLVLGNATKEPLEHILARATRDPLLEVILTLGPFGLYHLLQQHPYGKKRFAAREAYTGICELCQDITNDPELVAAVREQLESNDAKRLLVASRLWLDHKYIPAIRKCRSERSRVLEEA